MPRRPAGQPVPLRRQRCLPALGGTAARPRTRWARRLGARRPYAVAGRRQSAGDGGVPRGASGPGLRRPYVGRLLLALVAGAQTRKPSPARRRYRRLGPPWNLRGDRSVSGAPPAALWATDPAGFGQVGCVYTAQGFEYDWSGVIIGPDLLWRGDRWVTDRTASKDPVFKKSTSDDDVDRLIRNTYKVLLTRGMVGTVVFSTDSETREKLRQLAGGLTREPASV